LNCLPWTVVLWFEISFIYPIPLKTTYEQTLHFILPSSSISSVRSSSCYSPLSISSSSYREVIDDDDGVAKSSTSIKSLDDCGGLDASFSPVVGKDWSRQRRARRENADAANSSGELQQGVAIRTSLRDLGDELLLEF
jgi:hypothetical protein